MHVRRSGTHVEVLAPAKINLFLEVLARRSDGYHEVETLLAAVAMYDTLTFIPQSGEEIQLVVRWALGRAARHKEPIAAGSAGQEPPGEEIPSGPENLVWRAAQRLRECAGLRSGALIHLIKRIPAAAGLGGASSDAAATLLAANAAWRLDWPRERLLEVAAELGSDVPFFLSDGPAICRGRGEKMEQTTVPRLPVVVVRPPAGLSTAAVYAACRPVDRPAGVDQLAAALRRGDAAAASQHLVNSLEPAAAALAPWLRPLQTALMQEPLRGAQMSGSGSSCFGICRSQRQARRIAARLSARRLGTVFSTATVVGGKHA